MTDAEVTKLGYPAAFVEDAKTVLGQFTSWSEGGLALLHKFWSMGADRAGIVPPPCPVVTEVMRRFAARSEVGMKKYGVTLMDEGLTESALEDHLVMEMMDAINYFVAKRIKNPVQQVAQNTG